MGGEKAAIVGMALRFPGASNPADYWRNILEARELVERAPHDCTRRVHAGATLEAIDRFDTSFFEISMAEAELMDPQHRLFLECCWEALEDSGYTWDGCRRVGVFAGCSMSTYLLANVLPARGFAGRPDELTALIGNDKDYLSTRVSYLLNLTGPSVGIQTACSSSLVAVHFAAQSVLNGESDLAIAGGVTIRVPQLAGYQIQEGGYLSPRGQCRPFDADADGAVFGNGAGCIVLKRLEDALADNDRVHAVLRSSAINNDGARKPSFTAPSVEGQQEAIVEALALSGIEVDAIGSVDAHGTGTQLGDPIEMAALSRAFGQFTAREQFCAVQSIKGSLGHLECAAGVASLIKAVLSIKYGVIPPACNFQALNPQIGGAARHFYINAEAKPWPAGPRRAGVSSFGIGGTNAHMILEEPPGTTSAPLPSAPPALLLPVSARTQASLDRLILAYDRLLDDPSSDVAAVCQSAAIRRPHHRLRTAATGSDASELRAALHACHLAEPSRSGVVFVYPGQGGQWSGMGNELRRHVPVFARAFDRCRAALLAAGGSDLVDDPREEDIGRIQGSVWAMECALTEVWRSWGIEPQVVVGHSMGEAAAAWAAGVLTLEQSAAVMVERSRLLEGLVGHGAMLAVEAEREELEAWLEGRELDVAAENSPRWRVVSGRPEAVQAFEGWLDERGVTNRRLRTSGVAGHSRDMAALEARLEEALRGLHSHPALVQMVSTVSAERVAGTELGGQYWARNLREEVRFGEVVRGLVRQGYEIFVEVGPHAVLSAAVGECAEAEGRDALIVGTLRREAPELLEMLGSLGRLYSAGQQVKWRELYGEARKMASLPLYPWDRQRCWIEPPAAASRPKEAACFWETESSLESLPWIAEHRIEGEAVLPAAAYIQMAQTAWAAIGKGPLWIQLLEISQAFLFEPEHRYVLQISGTRREDGGYNLRISSRVQAEGSAEWRLHVSAILMPRNTENPASAPVTDLLRRLRDEIGAAHHYASVAADGIEYGESFQTVRRIRRGERESLAELKPTADGPGWLDGCLQSIQPLLEGAWAPVRFEGLSLESRPEGVSFAHARILDGAAPGKTAASLLIFSAAGKVVGRCDSVVLAPISARRETFYRVEWQEQPEHTCPSPAGRWLIVQDTGSAYGADLVKELSARDQPATLIGADAGAIDAHAGWSCMVYLSRGSAGYDPDICGRALPVLHRAALHNGAGTPCFWMITQGVQLPEYTSEPLIGGAPLWGLRRTMATECSQIRVGVIDIGGAEDLGALADELLTRQTKDEVVLRNGRRWTGRLSPFHLSDAPRLQPSIREDATYLITGGLGGLGMLTAEWLVEKGARSLALIGRSQATGEARRRVAALQAKAEVRVFIADVACERDLARSFDEVRARMPAIRGIVHAAGQLDDALLENLTPERFRRVLDPKAGGAWNLHQLSKDDPLDWFVCYSSAGSLLGAPGQANHASANAFLDVLSGIRRAQGLPALTVNWGPWAVHGKAAGEISDALRRRGLVPLDAAEAFRALETMLQSNTTQAACMHLDFAAWSRHYPSAARSPFFAELAARDRTVAAPIAGPRPRTALETERMLLQTAAGLLRCPPQSIDRKLPLREFGLDSLRALELRNRMEAVLGIRVPAIIMWRYPTVAALASHIHELASRSAEA